MRTGTRSSRRWSDSSRLCEVGSGSPRNRPGCDAALAQRLPQIPEHPDAGASPGWSAIPKSRMSWRSSVLHTSPAADVCVSAGRGFWLVELRDSNPLACSHGQAVGDRSDSLVRSRVNSLNLQPCNGRSFLGPETYRAGRGPPPTTATPTRRARASADGPRRQARAPSFRSGAAWLPRAWIGAQPRLRNPRTSISVRARYPAIEAGSTSGSLAKRSSSSIFRIASPGIVALRIRALFGADRRQCPQTCC